MKKRSIKSHLSQYSILQKRTTTINHAFASAIAPMDKYDEATLDDALRLLGQNPDDLKCIYCEFDAETWDHLIGLVENGELRGYGHQLGNLVPCCRKCNSEKGGKDWEVYLREKLPEPSAFTAKRSLITSYLKQFAPIEFNRAEKLLPKEWARYREIKGEIIRLMGEADIIASSLREAAKGAALAG